MRIGVIGTGQIGAAIARLATAAGIEVILANSRGPESIEPLVQELGELARASSVDGAAGNVDAVVLAVPLRSVPTMRPDLLDGKTVLSPINYYPFRDGRIAELDDESRTAAELVQQHFRGANLVQVFSNILAHHIPELARPSRSADRSALPMAGNDDGAKAQVTDLIDQLGFDTVDVGPLAESWRFEPESLAYTRQYLADPATPGERILEAAAAPVSRDRIAAAVKSAARVRVADRAF